MTDLQPILSWDVVEDNPVVGAWVHFHASEEVLDEIGIDTIAMGVGGRAALDRAYEIKEIQVPDVENKLWPEELDPDLGTIFASDGKLGWYIPVNNWQRYVEIVPAPVQSALTRRAWDTGLTPQSFKVGDRVHVSPDVTLKQMNGAALIVQLTPETLAELKQQQGQVILVYDEGTYPVIVLFPTEFDDAIGGVPLGFEPEELVLDASVVADLRKSAWDVEPEETLPKYVGEWVDKPRLVPVGTVLLSGRKEGTEAHPTPYVVVWNSPMVIKVMEVTPRITGHLFVWTGDNWFGLSQEHFHDIVSGDHSYPTFSSLKLAWDVTPEIKVVVFADQAWDSLALDFENMKYWWEKHPNITARSSSGLLRRVRAGAWQYQVYDMPDKWGDWTPDHAQVLESAYQEFLGVTGATSALQVRAWDVEPAEPGVGNLVKLRADAEAMAEIGLDMSAFITGSVYVVRSVDERNLGPRGWPHLSQDWGTIVITGRSGTWSIPLYNWARYLRIVKSGPERSAGLQNLSWDVEPAWPGVGDRVRIKVDDTDAMEEVGLGSMYGDDSVYVIVRESGPGVDGTWLGLPQDAGTFVLAFEHHPPVEEAWFMPRHNWQRYMEIVGPEKKRRAGLEHKAWEVEPELPPSAQAGDYKVGQRVRINHSITDQNVRQILDDMAEGGSVYIEDADIPRLRQREGTVIYVSPISSGSEYPIEVSFGEFGDFEDLRISFSFDELEHVGPVLVAGLKTLSWDTGPEPPRTLHEWFDNKVMLPVGHMLKSEYGDPNFLDYAHRVVWSSPLILEDLRYGGSFVFRGGERWGQVEWDGPLSESEVDNIINDEGQLRYPLFSSLNPA